MFYVVNIKHIEKDNMVHFTSGLVHADDRKEAMKKINVLFANWEIEELKIRELPDEFLERVKTATGGTVIAEFEEYTE